MAVAEVQKDPQAVLPYSLNWASEDGTNDGSASDTGWLQGDTIIASSWSITGRDTNLTIDSSAFDTKLATVILSAGTLGNLYKVTNHITTANGFEEDRTIEVSITDR